MAPGWPETPRYKSGCTLLPSDGGPGTFWCEISPRWGQRKRCRRRGFRSLRLTPRLTISMISSGVELSIACGSPVGGRACLLTPCVHGHPTAYYRPPFSLLCPKAIGVATLEEGMPQRLYCPAGSSGHNLPNGSSGRGRVIINARCSHEDRLHRTTRGAGQLQRRGTCRGRAGDASRQGHEITVYCMKPYYPERVPSTTECVEVRQHGSPQELGDDLLRVPGGPGLGPGSVTTSCICTPWVPRQ